MNLFNETETTSLVQVLKMKEFLRKYLRCIACLPVTCGDLKPHLGKERHLENVGICA